MYKFSQWSIIPNLFMINLFSTSLPSSCLHILDDYSSHGQWMISSLMPKQATPSHLTSRFGINKTMPSSGFTAGMEKSIPKTTGSIFFGKHRDTSELDCRTESLRSEAFATRTSGINRNLWWKVPIKSW